MKSQQRCFSLNSFSGRGPSTAFANRAPRRFYNSSLRPRRPAIRRRVHSIQRFLSGLRIVRPRLRSVIRPQRELATALHAQFYQVIAVIMQHDIFSSVDTSLDFATASLVCAHYGVTSHTRCRWPSLVSVSLDPRDQNGQKNRSHPDFARATGGTAPHHTTLGGRLGCRCACDCYWQLLAGSRAVVGGSRYYHLRSRVPSTCALLASLT